MQPPHATQANTKHIIASCYIPSYMDSKCLVLLLLLHIISIKLAI